MVVAIMAAYVVDAYTYFDHIRDYEGCRLVGEAFAQNTSIDFQNF